MAKYILILRPTDAAEEAFRDLDFIEVLNAMGRYNDELIRAGVLLAAEGFDPEESVVVDFTGETPAVVEGLYGEAGERFNGYYILDVASRDEAVEWAKRMPYMAGSKAEIRRVTTIDEFPQDNEWIQKERAWREETGQL